jgi:hypothetical protein
MAKADFKVTRTDGQTGKQSTVSRTTTSDAAHVKAGEHRTGQAAGGSDSYRVNPINRK